MKIALDFKEDCREEYKANLIKRNFEINEGTFHTIWVYGLSHIDYSKGSIELNQTGTMKFFVVLLEDLDFFEIHKDLERK